MNMITVASSNISAIGYEGSTLYIRFHSGSVYEYYNVPSSVYNGLMSASSKGTYHSDFIKNRYRYRRIG